ncbi:MAG: PIN domain-containing protein [Syntrophorhabdaceae bacterium]
MDKPKRIILVDFENIQRLDLDNIDTSETNIAIFVGKSQNKIPFALVEKAQLFGDHLVWVKIAGDGKNNLDFHLAFELGRISERMDKDVELIILSKDSGYDSLIRYINELGIKTRRIANPAELSDNSKPLPSSNFTNYIVNNLNKIDGQKRPRTVRTLKKHIESLLRDKAGPSEIDAILEEMFIRGLLSEINNRLKYTFDTTET